MNLYYFIFVWIFFVALLSQYVNVTYIVDEQECICRWKLVYATVVFVPVIYLVAFTAPRSDTVLYMVLYQGINTSGKGLMELLAAQESGKGFIVFQWIVKNIFSNESAFRLILALLHSIPVLYVFRKYSCDYLMSLYLFVASGCHIAWMMNGLRQFLAVSIIMAATPLMLKRKYVPLIGVILLAATVHSSALIMIPIIFIVQGKAWNKKTLLFIGVTIVLTYVFGRYTGLLDTLLVGTEYEGVMSSAAAMGDDGTNPIRVLVNSVPMIMTLFGKKILDEDNNPLINMCTNMSVITFGLYLVSMTTSGIMLGRLPIYTSLYSYILLPYVIRKVFDKQSERLFKMLMVVLYFLYYLYAYRGY